MLRALLKLLVLAGCLQLPTLQRQTVAPASAAEWEACLQSLNPQGYRYLLCADPKALMRAAHWQQYLDSYTLEATNYTPKLWRFSLKPKDVQLMLRAHRHPGFRSSLSPDQGKALQEAESRIARLITPGMSPRQKAAALHDDLVDTGSYSLRAATDATGMLLQRSGSCEAYARALQLLLEMVDIPCRLVYGTVSGGERHCWNMVWLDGQWLYIDATWNAVHSRGTTPSHRYFAIPAEDLAPTHTWEAGTVGEMR